MKTADFNFELPEHLIAQYPLAERTDSRLLVVGEAGNAHKHFADILDYVNPGDLLVFNNSRVMNARLYAQKETGGKVEMLIERVLDDTHVLSHVKASKALKSGQKVLIDDDIQFEMLERDGDLFKLKLHASLNIWKVMETHGHVPLPPYIERSDEKSDLERYQTVYAKPEGSVAAPTAGLHFDLDLLEKLKDKGVQTAEVTLHVGAGTFQPVRVDDVTNHHMHSEYIEVPEAVCEKIKATKAAHKRVIAVGTTSVRSLESASQSGEITPYFGDTNIFIYPGYTFNTVDGIITNFHLPESTLIMLVAAFKGKETILNAYKEAVENEYRFFSYGDAMLLI